MDFLKRNIELFESINMVDLEHGFYGARLVIAAGIYTSIKNKKKQDVHRRRANILIKQVASGDFLLFKALNEKKVNAAKGET